ncbi:MAG TPA: hypothetical protein VK154_12995, partial [Chitinophagales bacterium]|nr:hypothetical protein [Chitinophagales bacterium]
MKKLFAFALALMVIQFSFGQLVSSNDTTICAGTSAQLQTSGGTTYTWTPTTGLTGANTATPVAAPTATTTYVVSSPISNANIVVNGDFSQGNTGFTSEYNYETPTNINGSGSYFVGSNANAWNTNMTGCADRNGDVGSDMLIVNGSLTAGTKVWCQTHSVYPNTNYALSAWFQELHQQNYPVLQWNVNGTNVGNATQAIFFVCVFTNAQAQWNSGINTQATFCLIDNNIQGNGNDLAIDQISIAPTGGNMTDTVVVTVQSAPTVNLGADTAICAGQSLVLDAGNAGA